MNAVTGRQTEVGVDVGPICSEPARIALLGTGTVGSALLRRLASWQDTLLAERLSLVYVANSKVATHLSPSPVGAMTQGLRATGERAVERARCERGPGRGTGVGVGVRRSADDELTFEADSLRVSSSFPSSAYPHPPFGHLLPVGEGKSLVRSELDDIGATLGNRGTCILIDATASEAVAERHAEWLSQGIHVVTACKLAQGTSLQRWRQIQAARQRGGSAYGDSATVGAGLPLLRTIRELRAGGDRIHAIAGVLSGSLAWLFNHYDGSQPFSDCVREARAAGYTEPDPRVDLSGEDVRRKLLILARAAGEQLQSDAVAVDSLVPPQLARCAANEVDAALCLLDEPLRQRAAAADKREQELRFVARLAEGKASVGLESLAAGHPLCAGAGTDNTVAIWSDRYGAQPLVIQGPGAGAEVTAAGLLDDVLRIATRRFS